jgi:hypothetical protein
MKIYRNVHEKLALGWRGGNIVFREATGGGGQVMLHRLIGIYSSHLLPLVFFSEVPTCSSESYPQLVSNIN